MAIPFPKTNSSHFPAFPPTLLILASPNLMKFLIPLAAFCLLPLLSLPRLSLWTKKMFPLRA